MKQQKIITILARLFMGMSALSLLSVSLMAFGNPQSVMDLVGVKLPNTDAFSSIRGVYGGVGLTLSISIVYLLIKQLRHGLVFLTMLWGFYAISRLITIAMEGSLGAFGTQWLTIETIFCLMALLLLALYKPQLSTTTKK